MYEMLYGGQVSIGQIPVIRSIITVMAERYKIVVYVPEDHADMLREAMGAAGAGKIGNYSHCTFTSKGTGRFRPEEGARPTIGEVGNLEEVAEDRIETVCEEENLNAVLKAIRDVHPYEEPATDVYLIESL
jgi:hypothetical protein